MNSRFLPHRWFVHWNVALVCVMVTWCSASAQAADKEATQPRTLAFLGMQLQNDNAGLEPTTNEERAREQKVSDLFKKELEASGRFKFITVPPTMSAKIKAGQNIGECHGCEIDYGHQLGADLISWIKIQKVSNLILNLNVYMADVSTKKMTFVHSVDIRGNTDESWTRGLSYLVNNYLLPK
jgi:Protein of unknown function (DUF2380)